MYLVISPANDIVIQTFEINTAYRLALTRVAVWVYLNDIGDSDSFKFTLKFETGNFNAAQKVMSGAEIKTLINATQNYSHGKLFLDFGETVLIGRGRYSLIAEQLTGFSQATFLALCRDWEDSYFETEPTPGGDWSDPFYVRLYDQEGRQIS